MILCRISDRDPWELVPRQSQHHVFRLETFPPRHLDLWLVILADWMPMSQWGQHCLEA
jgi:hypothetical protein